MDHQVDLSPVLLGLCDGGVMTGGTFSYLPFLSPDGYIYEKEAILEYILHQKKEITLQLKAYEKQRSELKTEQEELSKAVKESQVKGFLEKELHRGNLTTLCKRDKMVVEDEKKEKGKLQKKKTGLECNVEKGNERAIQYQLMEEGCSLFSPLLPFASLCGWTSG
uniref:Uncharacterized protein LOC117352262 n=1 Tax=Geotrypetes seraphini TaxID=260995 RepID=A0A6P8PKT2_GEOSA|nr:uncharacterized protein LOC117352262 [Geotrypetes seraphini]